MAQLIREKGSKELIANYGYADGDEVINNFDSKYPWRDIEIVQDTNGNKWIRIYKFYTYYKTDENGFIKERYVSEYEADNNDEDWHINPIFLDGDKELPYVDIAAYLTYFNPQNNYKPTSIPGVAPTTNLSINDARTFVNRLNRDDAPESVEHSYHLFNIWASILEQDLFLIEFANSNTSSVLQGLNYNSWKNGIKQNGLTDNIPYVTGTKNKNAQDNGSEPMKYRGIENMIGNGRLVIDGIKITNGSVYVSYDGTTYVDSGVKAPTTSGRIHKLAFNNSSKLVFPAVIGTSGSYTDRYAGNNNSNQIILRGQTVEDGCGLFTTIFSSETASSKYNVYRMIRRPKI